MTSTAELRTQLKYLDPESRRALVIANLNKLAPIKQDLKPWGFEQLKRGSHWGSRGVNYQEGHKEPTSTCPSCWQERLDAYKEAAR